VTQAIFREYSRKHVPVLALAGCLLAGIACPCWGVTLQPPEAGVYEGAFPDTPEDPGDVWKKNIEDYQTLIRKPIAWATLMNDFTDGPDFPWAAATECIQAGTSPFIRILPRSKREQGDGPDPVFGLDLFPQGKFDTAIRKWCDDARDFGSPILAEFAQEANGDWYGWGGFWWGGGGHTLSEDLPDGPNRYRQAFRHFVDLCRDEGTKNITWFFHMDSQPKPVDRWNKMANYYPGDDYVDWVGLSVFGAQYPSDPWNSFSQVFDRAYQEMSKVTAAKPMAILEFGVIEKPGDPAGKPAWLRDALGTIQSGKYPRIKGINYWHESAWDDGGDNDFRVDSSAASLDAFRSEIQKPFFVSKAVFK
jgi:hypothetical protein